LERSQSRVGLAYDGSCDEAPIGVTRKKQEDVMTETAWTIRGEYMESCNCDYLCPCIYTNPQAGATNDNCTVMMIYRVDEGRFGETRLDGLKFALVFRTGKVMADGGWTFGGVIDEEADGTQRAALSKIVGGEAGGRLQMIRDALVSDFRGIEIRPISFEADGLNRRVEIPGVLSYAIEGVLSRNNSGEPFYIDNVAHPAASRLALARTKESHLDAFGLKADLVGQGNNGHFACFSWTS
jgi:hypothetical protein